MGTPVSGTAPQADPEAPGPMPAAPTEWGAEMFLAAAAGTAMPLEAVLEVLEITVARALGPAVVVVAPACGLAVVAAVRAVAGDEDSSRILEDYGNASRCSVRWPIRDALVCWRNISCLFAWPHASSRTAIGAKSSRCVYRDISGKRPRV